MSESVLVPIYGTKDGKRGVVVAHAQVSPEDAELASAYRWNLANGYAQVSVRAVCPETRLLKVKTLLLHRLILPDATTIDHINRDRLDNRRENLREATAAQNSQNTVGRSATGFKGVLRRGEGAFVAQLGREGVKLRGPVRSSPEEAARDYDALVLHHLGADSLFNFPGEADPQRLSEEWLTPRTGRRTGPRQGTKTSGTGYRGVTKVDGRFMAYLRIDGSNRSLGRYDTAEEAARVHDAKAKEVFGDAAILNEVV